MSLHIEPTEEAVETLRKERRKNYIAALATSILSVVLAGAILYSLTIIIAAPEARSWLHHAGRCRRRIRPAAEVRKLPPSMRSARQGRGGSGRRPVSLPRSTLTLR
ncbi:MAG: hypothetical protein ACLSUW_00960 [Akkermansia sp.]